MLENKPEEKYISLSEAAKYSGCYSQEYLSLRARQGKLKAVKFGRNWVTTKEWLHEYLIHTEEFKNNRNNNKVNHVSVKRKIPEATKVEKIKPIFTQPVSPRAIAVVVALVFVLASVGTLFASPYFTPVLKSANNFIKDGIIELVSDIGEFTSGIGKGIIEVGDNVSESIFYLTIDISTGANLISQKLSRNISNSFSNFKSGVMEYGIALKEGTLELGSRTVLIFRNFGTNVSVGASLIGKEISNKLAQRFIAGISNIPKELKHYLSQDIKALKSFGTRTILGVSYRIKDFWNNSTYGLRDIGENIDQGIKNMRNIGERVRYKIGRSTGIATKTIQTLRKFGKNLGYKIARSSQVAIEGIQRVGKIISYLFGKAYQYVEKAYQYIVRTGRTILAAFEKVPGKIVGVFKKEREPEFPEEKFLPKPEKEGLIVIPSTEKDEEIIQKIKASFSDEVRVEPKDETSGTIIPIFKEREGQKYLYLMVPVKE